MDEYGFERPSDFDYATYEEFMSEYLKVLANRAKKWAEIVGNGRSLQRSLTIKRFVRKGIPGEHRGMVITIFKSLIIWVMRGFIQKYQETIFLGNLITNKKCLLQFRSKPLITEIMTI